MITTFRYLCPVVDELGIPFLQGGEEVKETQAFADDNQGIQGRCISHSLVAHNEIPAHRYAAVGCHSGRVTCG